MAGGGAILFLVIVIVMAVSCRHLTARRNQPTMAYYSPHSAHCPNGSVHRSGVTPKLTVWVEKGDGNSYWWETWTKVLEVCLQMLTSWRKSLMKQISDWRVGGERSRMLGFGCIQMNPTLQFFCFLILFMFFSFLDTNNPVLLVCSACLPHLASSYSSGGTFSKSESVSSLIMDAEPRGRVVQWP